MPIHNRVSTRLEWLTTSTKKTNESNTTPLKFDFTESDKRLPAQEELMKHRKSLKELTSYMEEHCDEASPA